jgi:Na+/H+-dicarboxylate symporter
MMKSLSTRIFIGLFAGLILGTLVQYFLNDIGFFSGNLVELASGVGTMFVNMIMMLVVPLVFVSIVCGVCELQDLKSFGRLGGKTFGFYIINTVVAISTALLVVLLLDPGKGVDMSSTDGVAITATMISVDLLVMAGYTGLASRVLRLLRTPKQQRRMNRTFAGLFIGAATLLATIRRAPV